MARTGSNFPNGLFSYGVPVFGVNAVHNPWTRVFFVDGNRGSDGRDGRSPEAAYLTMDKAFDNVASGDTIVVRGNIREELSTPVGVFDVTIIGAGNRPRHADAHTGNGGYSAATWKTPASPTAATPLLTIRQQGWKIVGILFDGPSDAAAVQVFRDGGSGDDERDGSHVWIAGCKFVAGQNHIEFKGGLSQCFIEDNDFFGATADSLVETVGAGIGTNNFFVIRNNRFNDNDGCIDIGLNKGNVYGNVFGKFTTTGVDLATGADNQVVGNYMSGDYSNTGGYVAGTSDNWNGNLAEDDAETEVGDNGLTIAVPAA